MTLPASELLDEILRDPDRDRCPGAPPIVCLREQEAPDYLAAVEAREAARVVLERRGRWHGEWAVLRDDAGPRDAADSAPLEARLHERWLAARPILLRGAVERTPWTDVLRDRMRLADDLAERGGLHAFLRRAAAELAPAYSVEGPLPLTDSERDLERIRIAWTADAEDPRAPRMRDLWVKSGWLSSHEDDGSLRLRLSFGREGDDDASRDVRLHRRVAGLAERLLPECRAIHDHEELRERLTRWVGADVLFSQHIAYWNAPEGGALFHHDAFDEAPLGGQRGVVFVQLVGRTAWLALSLADLAARVAEFVDLLEQGEAPWVRHALFPRGRDFEAVRRLCADATGLRRELSRPGCGRLGPVVEQGSEFTGFLADGGHGLVLEPGDVLVLPNHGLASTCMHSVFCADDDLTYGLSLAIRERDPAAPETEWVED